MVDIGVDAQLTALDDLVLRSIAEVTIDALARMTAESATAAAALAVTSVVTDVDALINIGDGSVVEGENVIIEAENRVDVKSYARGESTADIAGAFAVAASRVVVGKSSPSQAKVTIGSDAVVSGSDVTIQATNKQKNDDIKSASDAESKTNTVAAIAAAEASGTVNVQSQVETQGGSEVRANDLTLHAESDYTLKRIPTTAAKTVVWFETVTKVVNTVVCGFLSLFGAGRACRRATSTVTEVVQHTAGAAELSMVTGEGLKQDDKVRIEGNVQFGGGMTKKLVIDEEGEIDEDASRNISGNEIITTDETVEVLDLINAERGNLAIRVPRGEFRGNGTVFMNTAWQTVRIENHSDRDLIINRIDMLGEGRTDGLVIELPDGKRWQDAGVHFMTDSSSNTLEIVNETAADIILQQPIDNHLAAYEFANYGGSIFAERCKRLSPQWSVRRTEG